MKKFAALLAIGIALTSTSCSSYLMSHIRHYPYSFNEESGRMIKRVALAPTNLLSPLPAKLNDRGDAVSRALAAYLTGHGITVISQGEAIKTTWEEEKRKAGGIYNSTDGSLQKDKFADSVKATVQRVCADQSVDAVLFHDIIARRATLDRSVLYWDGVQQNIETDKGFADPFTETFSRRLIGPFPENSPHRQEEPSGTPQFCRYRTPVQGSSGRNEDELGNTKRCVDGYGKDRPCHRNGSPSVYFVSRLSG